jgi:hypothetical protein
MKKSLSLLISVLVCGLTNLVLAESKADIATTLAEAVRSADEVRFVTKINKESIVTAKQNPAGLAELGLRLAGAEYRDLGLQWHVTKFGVEFWKQGKKVCSISPNAAVDTLRCEVPGFGVSDYNVGREVVSAFEKWANQALKHNDL